MSEEHQFGIQNLICAPKQNFSLLTKCDAELSALYVSHFADLLRSTICNRMYKMTIKYDQKKANASATKMMKIKLNL
jgi:hypothetical protein